MASEPEGLSAATLDRWKFLGPLTVSQILKNSNIEELGDIEPADLEFKKFESDHDRWYCIGFFIKGTEWMHGIGRSVDLGNIHEGMYKDHKRHGFGKCCFADGDKYEGMWEDGDMNG